MTRPTLIGTAVARFLESACSPLRSFDALVPKDRRGARVARGVAYGDGPRRLLDVYAPRQQTAAEGPRPVIVFFYGGSWNSGTREGYSFLGRALASRGFVTVLPDYRLVPDVRYPGFVEDGSAAVRWAVANAALFGGDPSGIVVAGHSAGAYIAAMLAVDPRWLGRARQAVKGLIGLAGPYDFAPFDVAASREAFGEWHDPAETQPVTWAGAGAPPALLLVGGQDELVRPANSAALAAKLRRGGVSVRVVEYPKLGHIGIMLSIAQPFRRRAPVLADISAFVKDVTG